MAEFSVFSNILGERARKWDSSSSKWTPILKGVVNVQTVLLTTAFAVAVKYVEQILLGPAIPAVPGAFCIFLSRKKLFYTNNKHHTLKTYWIFNQSPKAKPPGSAPVTSVMPEHWESWLFLTQTQWQPCRAGYSVQDWLWPWILDGGSASPLPPGTLSYDQQKQSLLNGLFLFGGCRDFMTI